MIISDRIHLVKIDFEVQISPDRKLPRFVNSVIVFGDFITVIDSGVCSSYNKIYDYIKKQGRSISEIKYLILSHSHPDHIGSAGRIKADTGCSVICHELEKEWIEDIDKQYAARPVPGFYNLVKEPVQPDMFLSGGEKMDLGSGIEISIINTPGHSRGSFCILFDNQSIIFTADSVPVVNDIPTYDDYPSSIESLHLISSMKERYSILLSSWASPVIEPDKITELIEDGEKYLKRIDAAVKKHYGRSDKDLQNCNMVIKELGLPPVFANPLTDRAFRTHTINK